MAFITKPEVEAKNVQRVILKAKTFSQNIVASSEKPTYKARRRSHAALGFTCGRIP